MSISPAEAHIEILSHIEFQYGGSKTQDSPGLLGRNLAAQFLDPPFEFQYVTICPPYFNKSKIPPRSPVQSWILDLSAILKFNVFQYFNVVLCPSWFCCVHGSFYCLQCISAASKRTKKPMDTLPHEPEKIDFWFFWDSRALKQTKMNCFETVQLFG